MMAQAVAIVQNATASAITPEEQREILEYEKIVQFRDAIFAGTHPRIKIPQLAGRQAEALRNVSSSSSLSMPRPGAAPQYARPTSRNQPTASPHATSRPSSTFRVTGNSEINPILLEKSDDLIRAETQLQRQRLERSLREQIEQQKVAAKPQLQPSEILPDFNISEVLTKALALVPPISHAEVEPSAGARSPASDSFDENTFYSSQHDTPEPFSSPSGQKEPGEVQSNDILSIDERRAETRPAERREPQDVLSNNNNLASHLYSQAHDSPSQLPEHARSAVAQAQAIEMTNSESSSSREPRVGDTSDVSSQQKEDTGVSTLQSIPQVLNATIIGGPVNATHEQVHTENYLQQGYADKPASPLIRAHNLSPIAPQPARVSPLATARAPPIVQEHRLPDEVQPAQVAALRLQPAGVSSTDSSPKGAKSSEKKKGKKDKKKKRKASINDNASPDSPYIKPEPRSPSPFSAMPLPRPQKRQRQAGQFAAELNYDEPTGSLQERTERYEPGPVPRERQHFEDHYDPRPRRVEPSYHRIAEDDEYRVRGDRYVRRVHAQPPYAVPYGPGEAVPVRAASHGLAERRVYEEPVYYREPVPRYSVRPDGTRERSRSPIFRERRSPMPMAPPRAPVRIVVDAYGREYIDPTPQPALRQSVAPPTRYRDSEVVYERAPMRAASARGPEVYEDGGAIFRRPSPSLVAPRRVITQPEYSIPEHLSPLRREYRQGTAAPLGEEPVLRRRYHEGMIVPPGEDFAMMRRQMSHLEEVPREYAPRAPSARPEPVRYEIPPEFVGRLQSVRPEPPPREYATSVRPEARREMPAQAQRALSVRPVEPIAHREPGAGPEGGRYYDEVPRGRPAEVAFIERPRAREASVVVYADDVRREMYSDEHFCAGNAAGSPTRARDRPAERG